MLGAAGKGWPIGFGAGWALGQTLSECQFDFSHPEFFHAKLVKVSCGGLADF